MEEPGRRPVRDRQAVSLQGRRAGLVSRAMADLVDLCVLGLLGLAALLVVELVRTVWVGPRLLVAAIPLWLAALTFVAVQVVYLAYFWSTTGRTPGKQLLGLRVVDLAQRRLRGRRALVRAFLCLIFPAGLLWILVSRDSASIQDLLVRTQVVYDWTYRHVDADV